MQQMCCVPFLPSYDSYMVPEINLISRERTFVISYCDSQEARVAGMRLYIITPLLLQAATSAMTYYAIPSPFSLLKFHERCVYQRQCVFAWLVFALSSPNLSIHLLCVSILRHRAHSRLLLLDLHSRLIRCVIHTRAHTHTQKHTGTRNYTQMLG